MSLCTNATNDETVEVRIKFRLDRDYSDESAPSVVCELPVKGNTICKACLSTAITQEARLRWRERAFGGDDIIQLVLGPENTIVFEADIPYVEHGVGRMQVPDDLKLNVVVWAEELYNFHVLGRQWTTVAALLSDTDSESTADIQELSDRDGDTSPVTSPVVPSFVGPTSTFLALPLEILGLILGYLWPPEYIALRKTCKILCSITYGRRLWMDAMKSVCAKYGAFFHHKSASQQVLEEAALAPYRFASTLLNSPPYWKLHPKHTLIKYPFTPDFRICSVFLVPGGRFLFVLETNDESCSVHLWDLDFADPVETCCWEHEAEGIDETQAVGMVVQEPTISQDARRDTSTSADTGAIHLAVVTRDDAEVVRVRVLEIYPLSPSPKCDAVATLAYDPELGVDGNLLASSIPFMKSSNGRVAFLRNGTIVVWNFKEDTLAAWIVGNVYDSDSELLFLESLIILFQGQQITWWQVPPLVPRKEFDHPRILQWNGVFVGPIFPVNPDTTQQIKLTSATVLNESCHPAARLTYVDEGTRVYHHHFDLRAIPSAHGIISLHITPLLTLSEPTRVPPEWYFSSDICEGLLFQSYTSITRPYQVMGMVTEYSQHKDKPDQNKAVRLCAGLCGFYDLSMVRFDPLSGRFCILDQADNICVFTL